MSEATATAPPAPQRMSPGLFLVCAIFALLGAFVAAVYVFQPGWGWFLGDFTAHIGFAQQLKAGEASLPHSGFHWLIIATSWLTTLDLRLAAIAVVSFATAASAYFAFRIIEALAPQGSQPARLTATVLTGLASSLVIMSVVPNWYVGMGSPNVWHSPTWMAMQPLGLWVVLVAVRGRFDHRRSMALAGVLLAAGVAIKPNFALAFLPACWAWMLFRRRDLLFSATNLLLSLPACALLGYQLVSEYLAPGSDDGIVLAPFAVWGSYSPCLPCSIVMATLFPLVVLWTRRGLALRTDAVVLTVLLYLFALLQYALFAESGERMMHANWMWGYNYALKVLFVVAAGLLVQTQTPTWARRTGWAALGLHALFGVRHLVRAMMGLGFR